MLTGVRFGVGKVYSTHPRRACFGIKSNYVHIGEPPPVVYSKLLDVTREKYFLIRASPSLRQATNQKSIFFRFSQCQFDVTFISVS